MRAAGVPGRGENGNTWTWVSPQAAMRSAVLSNIDGGTIRIQGARLDLTYAQLANEDISTPANAMAALTQWEQSITDVEDALGSFGADLRALCEA